MKKTGFFLILLAVMMCLMGCFGEPKEKEKDAVREKGEKIMREWLDRTYPDAEIVSIEPYVFHKTGVAPYKLTDTVSGTFRSGNEEQTFWLDTISGSVYFEQDKDVADELTALCEGYTAQVLGLGDGYEARIDSGAFFDLGTSDTDRPVLLPAEFVISGGTLENLVRSPKDRPVITVSILYSVPDSFDVSAITFGEAGRILDEYGLLLDVTVKSGRENVTVSGEGADYQRMEFVDMPDFRIWMPVYERVERPGGDKGDITTRITERTAGKDIVIERDEDGFYRPQFPNGWFHALVYAYDDSEMLQHTYYYVSDNGMTVELEWRKTGRGWQLGLDDSYLSDSRPFAEKK